MDLNKLKQEAEEWLNKWELCNKCDHKVQCIEDNAMCPQVVERAYLAGAEPREKRIAELEEKLTEKVTLESLDVVSGKITELEEAKANLEYLLEGRDNEITDLEKKNKVLTQNLEDTEIINKALEKENAELKSIADFQQSGNMSRYFELKRQAEKLEEAKELLKKLLVHSKRYIWIADDNNKPIMQKEIAEAEQFLNSEVEK